MYDLTLVTPGPLCYHADAFDAQPVRAGSFVGSVHEGGSVNHYEIRFTPHGTGTHTECYGHIVDDPEATIDRCLRMFRFKAKLISAEPERMGQDQVVTLDSVRDLLPEAGQVHAVILRTLPNGAEKKTANYSGANPPYLEAALAEQLVRLNVQHLLVDLPSVDKEVDGGALRFHRTFWQTDGPRPLRKGATITELIFVPDEVADGFYTLYLAPAAWKLDAAPSRVWIDKA